jgi:hypothetical protein
VVVLNCIAGTSAATGVRWEGREPTMPFKGKISTTFEDSVPDFPQPIRAPKGAPNIVDILLDDGESSQGQGAADLECVRAVLGHVDKFGYALQRARYITPRHFATKRHGGRGRWAQGGSAIFPVGAPPVAAVPGLPGRRRTMAESRRCQ